ncbi:hypothetical protein [Erwinia billingiae]|uniref:hypothetical protein n=1 Tax=Erwinia billingiae TaxID=182337 RepID=UPI002247DDDE|nr:hypothetical protein [Erwinia billingiae]MCX0499398.1 hypothetical protein [Erwinia billingiae]
MLMGACGGPGNNIMAGATGAAIGIGTAAGMSSDDSETENQPNVGKDLSDDDKAELGGTGSGTPGGWGPEDEENARNGEAGQKPTAGEKIGKWSVDELSDGAKHIDSASKKGDLP